MPRLKCPLLVQTEEIKLDIKYIFKIYLILLKTIIHNKVLLVHLVNSLSVTEDIYNEEPERKEEKNTKRLHVY